MGSSQQLIVTKGFILFAVLIQLSACSPKSSSFTTLCRNFDKLVDLNNYTQMTSEERNTWLLNKSLETLSTSDMALQAWNAIANATASERYQLYKDAALSTGLEDWNCDSMKLAAHEVGAN